jgi:phage terminase large subunit-like protein
VLYPTQARFLREALTPTADGRLPFPELLFSAPKKSGKTGMAAMATLYVVMCLGGHYAEGYRVANDFDQAQGRVFQAVVTFVLLMLSGGGLGQCLYASVRLAGSR